LKIAKSKDGMMGKDRTMLDEDRRVTFGYVDNSELPNSHPTIGRLNSLEGPLVGTGDREVTRDIVALDDQVPYLPMPVRKCGE
jgi:hypothetical protein